MTSSAEILAFGIRATPCSWSLDSRCERGRGSFTASVPLRLRGKFVRNANSEAGIPGRARTGRPATSPATSSTSGIPIGSDHSVPGPGV